MTSHLPENALPKVREYLELSGQITELEAKKDHIREQLLFILEKAGERMLQAAGYRIQKYLKPVIKYDMDKLVPLVRDKGIASKVLSLVVNDKGMEQALKDGEITLEELQEVSKTEVRVALYVKKVEEEE